MLITLLFVMMITGFVQWLLRRERIDFWFRSDEAVVNYVQMLTVFYGLLLGLVAVDLWQKKDDAVKNTANEANQIRIRRRPGVPDRSVWLQIQSGVEHDYSGNFAFAQRHDGHQ